jgi:hypothetical protein
MSLQSRVGRLARAVPCPRCAGEAGAVVFRWLEPRERPPQAASEAGEASCPACGKRSGRVIYVTWLRSGRFLKNEKSRPRA